MSEISQSLDTARERLKAQMASEYLTVEEAAELARCNPMTIRRAFYCGALPAFRPAHRVLLRESDVREWIERRLATEPARAAPRRRSSRRRAKPERQVLGGAADLRQIERELT